MQIEPRLIVALSLIFFASPALAEDPPPTPRTDTFAVICDAYGPGYRNIPGTDICLRVGAYVQLDAVGRLGKVSPGSGKDRPQPDR